MEVGRNKSHFSRGWRANYILNQGTREPDIPKVPLTPHMPPYFNPSHHHQHPPPVCLPSLTPVWHQICLLLSPWKTPPSYARLRLISVCPPIPVPHPAHCSPPNLAQRTKTLCLPCDCVLWRTIGGKHRDTMKERRGTWRMRRVGGGPRVCSIVLGQNFGPQGKASERAWAPPTGP